MNLDPTVYACLRAIAQNQMNHERAGHTRTATALGHEAVVRIGEGAALPDRAAFVRAAAEAMRRILIEHARAKARVKRGGRVGKVSLEAIGDVAALDLAGDNGESILAFDGAFGRLQEHDEGVADVVRLRFFAGLGVAETATALAVSERTVNYRWAYARAWLARELRTPEGTDGADPAPGAPGMERGT